MAGPSFLKNSLLHRNQNDLASLGAEEEQMDPSLFKTTSEEERVKPKFHRRKIKLRKRRPVNAVHVDSDSEDEVASSNSSALVKQRRNSDLRTRSRHVNTYEDALRELNKLLTPEEKLLGEVCFRDFENNLKMDDKQTESDTSNTSLTSGIGTGSSLSTCQNIRNNSKNTKRENITRPEDRRKYKINAWLSRLAKLASRQFDLENLELQAAWSEFKADSQLEQGYMAEAIAAVQPPTPLLVPANGLRENISKEFDQVFKEVEILTIGIFGIQTSINKKTALHSSRLDKTPPSP